MNNDLFKERAFLAGTLSFIFSLLSTIILLLLVKTFFLGNANTQPDLSLLNATGAALAAPEPIERTLFFAGFFSLPIFLFVFFWAFDQLIAHNRILHVKTAVSAALGGMGIFLSYSLFTYFSRYASLLGHAKYSRSFPVIVTGGIVGLTVGAIAAWFVARQILRANAVSGSRLNVFWGAIAGLFILLSFLMSLFGMGAITEHPIFTNHFNAVFQAVVQVVNGKAVLLNFPHQYGLYPHFIEPIFHLFGLSVFKFTVLMGLLMAIGELAVLACLNRLVQNPLISKMGFVAAIFFSAYLVKSFSATHDFYFHYFPLRFIFPALAMYFMLRYFEDNSWTKSLFGFLLGALAVLWNLDVGVVVFGAVFLGIEFCDVLDRNWKGAIKNFLLACLTMLAVLAGFIFYFYLRYHAIPDPATMVTYQRAYAILGVSATPMTLIHPWNLVVAVYGIGFLYAFGAVNPVSAVKRRMVFFLTILGAGLFTYFQLRSHDFNLISASYPALILLAIFCDDLRLYLNNKKSALVGAAYYSIVWLLITINLIFLVAVPVMCLLVYRRLEATLNRSGTPITQNYQFLKQQLAPGAQILILSQLSGVYHMAERTKQPVNLPSIQEQLLLTQDETLFKYLADPGTKIVVLDNDLWRQDIKDLVKKNFRLEISDPGGQIGIYKKGN